jgi:hypothetical protein
MLRPDDAPRRRRAGPLICAAAAAVTTMCFAFVGRVAGWVSHPDALAIRRFCQLPERYVPFWQLAERDKPSRRQR